MALIIIIIIIISIINVIEKTNISLIINFH